MKNLIATTTIVLTCLFTAGCDKPTGCKTSHWPEPGVSINWDGCNDVNTVLDYFDCHDSALYQHHHDTIEIRGQISIYNNCLVICSDTALLPENAILLNTLDGSTMPFYSSQTSKLTGTISPGHTTGRPCCNVILVIDVLKIEEL